MKDYKDTKVILEIDYFKDNFQPNLEDILQQQNRNVCI